MNALIVVLRSDVFSKFSEGTGVRNLCVTIMKYNYYSFSEIFLLQDKVHYFIIYYTYYYKIISFFVR